MPTRVVEDKDWTFVTLGARNTCALKEHGALWCWGHNDHGELGDGRAATNGHQPNLAKTTTGRGLCPVTPTRAV
ncbi:MAG: hypothetical protein IPK13_27910 [Deltaproteobacteria bacterium]|nr:hypothetical protein [Deltaproteobacteria bacterium]